MSEKFQRLLTGAPQTRCFIAVAFLALVLQLLLWFFEIRYWPLYGDEEFYFDCALHINAIFSAIIANDHAAIRVHMNQVIAHGFFLPGMSLLLQPAVYLGWDLPQTRLYMAILNFALTLVITLRLKQWLPAPVALFWMATVLFFPAALLFAPTLWGESIGGKFYLLVLIELYRALERGGSKQNLLLPVVAGLALAVIIYIRPNFIVISPLLVFVVFYHRRRSDGFAQAVAGAARFGVIAALTTSLTLLPWQLAMYRKFGVFFLTTTSVEFNTIIAYADKKTYRSQFPGRGTLNIFVRTHKHIQERVERTGENYGTALREERRKVLSELTLARYITATGHSLRDFFFSENMFLYYFRDFPGDAGLKNFLYPVLFTLNSALWYVLLVCTLVAFFLKPKSPTAQGLSLFMKWSLLLLWIQPFMSLSSGRYLVGFLPLMALLLSLYAGDYYPQRINRKC
jgi:hypothetical protein